MIVPDANLLIHAYDATSSFHTRARRWWERCLSGDEQVGLALPVIFAFVRLSTSAKVFSHPMTLPEVTGAVAAWLERRVVRILEPEADHVERVLELLADGGSAGGNLVTDAQIAVLAISYHGVVHTADRDFGRFPGLGCHYPLD
jgi:toxin-antitoxin system PIN domain toxin